MSRALMVSMLQRINASVLLLAICTIKGEESGEHKSLLKKREKILYNFISWLPFISQILEIPK
jgi:hypothetical protein